MSTTTIPQLPQVIALNGTELIEVVQGGVSSRAPVGMLVGGIPSPVITINFTAIVGGASGRVLYDNAGTVGELATTGSGNVVLATSPTITSPTLVTPALGVPASGVLTNATGLPLTTGVTGVLGATNGGTAQSAYAAGDLIYASAINTLSRLAAGSNGSVLSLVGGLPAWVAESTVGVSSFSAGTTGLTPSIATTGAVVLAGTLGPANGGTGHANNAANILTFSGNFGLTLTLSGATALTLPTSGTVTALGNAVTGTGSIVLATSPALVTPALGTPSSGVATNLTGLPLTTGVTGILPVANGGTGSGTQNFVDITTTQAAIAGVKTFTTQLIGKGTATNDSAAAGYIGEYNGTTVLVGAEITLTSGVSADVASYSLPAGDYDISASVFYDSGSGTTITAALQWTSITSATFPTAPNNGLTIWRGSLLVTSALALGLETRRWRLSLATTTTVYISSQAAFSGGSLKVYGIIDWRRIR